MQQAPDNLGEAWGRWRSLQLLNKKVVLDEPIVLLVLTTEVQLQLLSTRIVPHGEHSNSTESSLLSDVQSASLT